MNSEKWILVFYGERLPMEFSSEEDLIAEAESRGYTGDTILRPVRWHYDEWF